MNSLRQETVKKLEELKENLSKNLYEDSYAELISIENNEYVGNEWKILEILEESEEI